MNKVDHIMNELELTDGYVAKRVGCSIKLIQYIRKSTDPYLLEYELSSDFVKRLARVLNVKEEWLKVLYVDRKSYCTAIEILRLVEHSDSVVEARNKIIERYKYDNEKM